MVLNLLRQINSMRKDVVRNVFLFDNGMSRSMLDQCCSIEGVSVINAHGKGIYEMWNMGVKLSIQSDQNDHICIFNDDLELIDTGNWFEDFLSPFEETDIWATSANYDYTHRSSAQYKDVSGTFKDKGFAGFCFAVQSNAYLQGLPLFDERYEWWYGDDDFVHSVHRAGKRTTMSLNAGITHINGGSQSTIQYTTEFNQRVLRDKDLYFSKWHREVVV
jgi:hypothetical protein